MMKKNNLNKTKSIFCDCKHPKWKIVRTHGKNSRGFCVCKWCGKVLKLKR